MKFGTSLARREHESLGFEGGFHALLSPNFAFPAHLAKELLVVREYIGVIFLMLIHIADKMLVLVHLDLDNLDRRNGFQRGKIVRKRNGRHQAAIVQHAVVSEINL